MIKATKNIIHTLLRKSENYTKTDMVYLAKGASWLSVSRTVNIVSAILLAVFYANFLSKDAYGIYKYVLSIISMLSILTLPGINTSLTAAIAKKREGTFWIAIKTKFFWSLLSSLLCIVISLYYFLNDNNNLSVIFVIFAISIPLNNSLIFSPILAGRKNFKHLAIFNSINQIITTIALLSFLLFSDNIVYFIFIQQLVTLFTNLGSFIVVIKKTKLNDKEDKEVMGMGKHLTYTQVISTIVNNIDKILILKLLSPVDLAIYLFALLPTEQLRNSLSVFTRLAFPKLAEKEKSTLKKTLPQKVFRFMLILIIPVILYITLLPYLYKLIFPNYSESILYAQIFALTLFLFPQRLFGSSFVTLNKKKEVYLQRTITPLIKLFLFVVLIPQYGLIGAIYSLIISKVFNSFLLFYLFKKM